MKVQISTKIPTPIFQVLQLEESDIGDALLRLEDELDAAFPPGMEYSIRNADLNHGRLVCHIQLPDLQHLLTTPGLGGRRIGYINVIFSKVTIIDSGLLIRKCYASNVRMFSLPNLHVVKSSDIGGTPMDDYATSIYELDIQSPIRSCNKLKGIQK